MYSEPPNLAGFAFNGEDGRKRAGNRERATSVSGSRTPRTPNAASSSAQAESWPLALTERCTDTRILPFG